MAAPVPPEVVINAGELGANEVEALRQASEIMANTVPIVVVTVGGLLFFLMSWLILHYMTKWKQAKTLTNEDEVLLDDLHDTARRLDDRLVTIERIVAEDRLIARK